MRVSADDIVCFAGNDWWVHNPLTEKYWMQSFTAGGRRVLFVNSIGIGMPGRGSPRVFRRIRRKLYSMSRFLQRDSGVWVLTPFVLPLWSIPAVRMLNVLLLTVQLRWAMKRAGMTTAIFWAGIPTAALLLRRIPHKSIVYYVQDNYTEYFDAMNFTRVGQDHATLLREADHVICASIGMHESIASAREGVHYIPHGVHDAFLDYDIESPSEAPAALQGIAHPIIGYWGSLEVLQDLSLVRDVARMHPEWSFVFIGRVMMDATSTAALPNVYYLGPLPIAELPRYGVHFDVGWMSFMRSEWVRYSCPIKYREYLALGLPVVSPPIIEVERAFPGEGRIASTVEEFSARITEALADGGPEQRRRRRALVQGQRWEATAEQVARVLEQMREDA